jgi:magnesium chelatase subunit I
MVETVFPFTAIIGQEEMKLSLVLNVIDPKIGGVMVMGDRGTGKSTAIRAMAELLPRIKVAFNDPFNSSLTDPELMSDAVKAAIAHGERPSAEYRKVPMIELPLGATEDRVCGTIDIEKALHEGTKSFEPGLLAKANRGILYVDEINLLDDHLVDVLLDSAASGWNTVEREGISLRHPARFVLVGSGNPEEGELRPQLLDRFGLHAEIRTERDPVSRVNVVLERTAFDKDPLKYLSENAEELAALKTKISHARGLLGGVSMPREIMKGIATVCSRLNIDGIRGDIVTNRAAKAYTAYHDRTSVTPTDVKAVITLCLRHRLRKDPLASIASSEQVLQIFKKVFLIIIT